MTPQTTMLLNEIKALGVELTTNGEKLRLTGLTSVITEDQKTRLKKAKPEIVKALKRSSGRIFDVSLNGQVFTMVCPSDYTLEIAKKSVAKQFHRYDNINIRERI